MTVRQALRLECDTTDCASTISVTGADTMLGLRAAAALRDWSTVPIIGVRTEDRCPRHREPSPPTCCCAGAIPSASMRQPFVVKHTPARCYAEETDRHDPSAEAHYNPDYTDDQQCGVQLSSDLHGDLGTCPLDRDHGGECAPVGGWPPAADGWTRL